MIPKKIASLQHPLVKHLVNLRNKKSYRQEQKSVLISGKKMIEELGNKHLFKKIIIEEGYETSSFRAEEVWIVTEEMLKKITGVEHPEGIAAEMGIPKNASLEGKNKILVLDGVSDPGNLGTLLRTALALNWDGIFITENSVDPFNDKALRAGKGATFEIPIVEGSWQELETLMKKGNFTVVIADKEGSDIKNTKLIGPLMLVLGNETRGVSEKAKQSYTRVSIPMNPSMESLNVAIAGAILMHELL